MSELRLGEQCGPPEELGGTCRVSLWGRFKYCFGGRLGHRSCEGSLRASARLPWLPLKGLSQGTAVLLEILQPGRILLLPAVPRASPEPAGIFTAALGNVAGFAVGPGSAQGPITSSHSQGVNLQVSFQEGTAELSRPVAD